MNIIIVLVIAIIVSMINMNFMEIARGHLLL